MQPTTFAGRAGRILGTTLALIDWAEVWATFLQGLQVTIVLALLAGRVTRHAWDSLPGLSERLGKAYTQLLGLESAPPDPAPAPEPIEPAVDYASLLEALSVKDLRKTCVTLGLPSKAYRAARKAELVSILADLHVNPTL